MKRFLVNLIAVLLLFATLISCGDKGGTDTTTAEGDVTATEPSTEENIPDNANPVAEKTMVWPEGQMFPTFSAPDGKLTAFVKDGITDGELVTLSCMEGLVNAVKTRMVILEGATESWLGATKMKYTKVSGADRYAKIKELAEGSVAGVVLYNDSKQGEMLSLACTVANTMRAIPIQKGIYTIWKRKGIELPILADLTELEFNNKLEIYQYLYDNYWEKCNHRLVLVQRTGLFQMRDLAAATGSAVLHLSCNESKDPKEVKLFKKFLADLEPGKAIVTGWYEDQERELMVVASQCGLSCVPSDFFSNGTVFAQAEQIKINTVPDMPKLENKIYVAYFLSDGDNIQYDMGAMKEYWTNNLSRKGKVAINWTISPALVDIAPGMMNFYYKNDSDKECFVCGPSGMGYSMPINTFGPRAGASNFKNDDFTKYIELTNKYMQKSGLRAVTIWDNLSKSQREIYSSVGTYLYGITVQNFTNGSLSLKYTGVVNNMLIQQMTPAYYANNAEGTNPLSNIQGDIKGAVSYLKYNGSAPVFVATQVSVWAYHDVNQVIQLEQTLSDYYAKIYGEDVVEFVRADHFFNLYYQSNGLPFDLTLTSGISASATSNSESANLTTDGTPSGDSIWVASDKGAQSVTYDLGGTYALSRVMLYNAETNGLDKSLNTKSFTVEVSSDGTNFTKVAEVKDNTDSFLEVKFDEVNGSYLRINITDAGSDGIARVADISIYGAQK